LVSSFPRINSDKLLRTAARRGDVVIEPALWPEIMDEISRAMSAEGAVLLQSDVRTPDVPRTASLEDFAQSYFSGGWHQRDIRAERGVPILLAGVKVIMDQDVVSPDEMRRSACYQENYLPNGFQWFTAVGFWAGSALWTLSVQRTPRQGRFEPADKRILSHLSDRLTQVATLSTAVGRSALIGITNALDLVPRAAIAMDRTGSVVMTNSSAERLFGADIRVDGLRRLVVADKRAMADIQSLRDRLQSMPDDVAAPTGAIVVRRLHKPPIIIRILPIDGPARGPFLAARVLLVLSDPSQRLTPTAELLRRAYGLTTAEANLAVLVATGISVDAAAEQLGVGKHTARNQLKAVFSKMGVHRQGELVALLLRL
jgi:DNA-binding CsgD family transcriptional regulator